MFAVKYVLLSSSSTVFNEGLATTVAVMNEDLIEVKSHSIPCVPKPEQPFPSNSIFPTTNFVNIYFSYLRKDGVTILQGVSQGCILYPLILSIYPEHILRE